MKPLKAVILSAACSAFAVALATSQAFSAEGQIVIENLSPSQLRAEIRKIETEFYRVYNNSIDDETLKVICYDFVPTGTNIKKETCEPQFLVDRRAANTADSRFGLDVLYSADSLRSELAPEFEALTEAMMALAEESEYFRELDSILAALRDELESR